MITVKTIVRILYPEPPKAGIRTKSNDDIG
jgi:hypothetical protein